MKIEFKENPLSNKEQLFVLLISTVAGFAASKYTENVTTKFLLRNKS